LKLIAISGAKHSKKDKIASKLSKNSDCIWIHPYTDREYPISADTIVYDSIYLNRKQLSDKMEREVPLCVTVVDGSRYVFFENQLNSGHVVLIGDDQVINTLKKDYKGKLITIKCHSKNEQPSERCTLPDSEFDIVFNVELDDYDILEELVGDIYDFGVGS